jgi:hypothetical protein
MGAGKLLHATNIRPDIAFAIGVVIRFASAPRDTHLDAVLTIFQYFKGTLNLSSISEKGRDYTSYLLQQ